MKTALFIFLSAFIITSANAQFSLLKDVNPGMGSNNGLFLYKIRSGLWVTCWNDGAAHNQEVWRTDGTNAGTSMVKDLNPGSGWGAMFSSDPYGVIMDHYYYFVGSESPTNITAMYKTDGTAAGTTLVSTIIPYAMARIDSTIYMGGGTVQTGVELYKSNGSTAGTVMIKDIWPGPNSGIRVNSSARTSNFVKANGLVFFRANDSLHGSELWRTDGTTAGTKMVRDIFPGLKDGLTNDYQYIATTGLMQEWKSILYFMAQDTTNNGQLWRTDGTEVGTYPLTSFSAASFMPIASPLVQMGDKLYFVYKLSTGETKLMVSDGTVAGTKPLLSQALSITSSYIAKGHSLFYFTANTAQEGNELWRSDGTAAGTFMLKDLNPGINNGAFALDYAKCLVAWNDIYFRGDNGQTGWEVYHSDGSAGNMSLAYDAYPGITGSNPFVFSDVGNRLAIKLTTPVSGEEEWISDNKILFLTLLSFTGTASGNNTVLDWKTTLEESGVYFEIERSSDSLFFTKIGTVQGTGDNEVQGVYSYLDPDLATGKYYYRLKIFNSPTNYKYSNIINVSITEVQQPVTAIMTILGNPVTSGTIRVKVNAAGPNDELQVVDMLGRIVRRQKMNPSTTPQIVDIYLGKAVANCSYILKAIINGKQSQSIKLIVLL